MEARHHNLENYSAAKPAAGARLRVLLDARKLEHGGIGVYIQNLIAGLIAQDNTDLTVLATRRDLSAYDWSNQVRIIEERARGYSLDELFNLPRRINWKDFDLFHEPHYTLPFGVRVPSVVTIHDLIHVNHPEKHYYPAIARRLVKSALKRATKVLTVSQASWQELKGLVGAGSPLLSKVSVVPNALDPFYLRQTITTERAQEWLAGRFKITRPFLLCVLSNVKPHKGAIDLIQAFDSIKARRLQVNPGALAGNSKPVRDSGDLALVLAGKGSEKIAEHELLLETAGAVAGVHVVGSLSREELAYLYAGAIGLVVPSLAEGFCLPVIEARAFGLPVIARPAPAVLELLGVSDVRCSDFSLPALERGLTEFFKGPERSKPARGEIMKQLKPYMAADIGRTIEGIYQEAAGKQDK